MRTETHAGPNICANNVLIPAATKQRLPEESPLTQRTAFRFPSSEVPTALVFAGLNLADHDRLFASLSNHLRANVSPHVIELREEECSTLPSLFQTLSRKLYASVGACEAHFAKLAARSKSVNEGSKADSNLASPVQCGCRTASVQTARPPAANQPGPVASGGDRKSAGPMRSARSLRRSTRQASAQSIALSKKKASSRGIHKAREGEIYSEMGSSRTSTEYSMVSVIKRHRRLSALRAHVCSTSKKKTHASCAPIIIVVNDFERFSDFLLQRLVLACSRWQRETLEEARSSAWKNRGRCSSEAGKKGSDIRDQVAHCLERDTGAVPFAFVFGIATDSDAVHRRLPQHCTALLRMRRFQVQRSITFLDLIVEGMLFGCTNQPEAQTPTVPNHSTNMWPLPVRPSGNVLAFLSAHFLETTFSVNTFLRALRFLLLEHFRTNRLSYLCAALCFSKAAGHQKHHAQDSTARKCARIEAATNAASKITVDDAAYILRSCKSVRALMDSNDKLAVVLRSAEKVLSSENSNDPTFKRKRTRGDRVHRSAPHRQSERGGASGRSRQPSAATRGQALATVQRCAVQWLCDIHAHRVFWVGAFESLFGLLLAVRALQKASVQMNQVEASTENFHMPAFRSQVDVSSMKNTEGASHNPGRIAAVASAALAAARAAAYDRERVGERELSVRRRLLKDACSLGMGSQVRLLQVEEICRSLLLFGAAEILPLVRHVESTLASVVEGLCPSAELEKPVIIELGSCSQKFSSAIIPLLVSATAKATSLREAAMRLASEDVRRENVIIDVSQTQSVESNTRPLVRGSGISSLRSSKKRRVSSLREKATPASAAVPSLQDIKQAELSGHIGCVATIKELRVGMATLVRTLACNALKPLRTLPLSEAFRLKASYFSLVFPFFGANRCSSFILRSGHARSRKTVHLMSSKPDLSWSLRPEALP